MQTIPCCFILCDNNELHISSFMQKILCHIYMYSLSKYGIITLTVETF